MIRYSKIIEKIILESAFDKKKEMPGIKFNPGLGLTVVRTTQWTLVEKAFTIRGNSRIKVKGMLDRKLNLSGRPLWVWLKLKLTPKEGHTIEDIKPFFVKFFMHIPKRYLNRKISDFPS